MHNHDTWRLDCSLNRLQLLFDHHSKFQQSYWNFGIGLLYINTSGGSFWRIRIARIVWQSATRWPILDPRTPCPTCIVVFLSRSESSLLKQRGSLLPRFGESALILTSPPERVAARGFSPEAAVRPPEEDHGPKYIFWGLPIWHRRVVSLTFFLACFLGMKLRLILSVLYSLSVSCVQSRLLAVNPQL